MSAFDITGFAKTTDVFVKVATTAPPPPPAPVDLFDASACAGPRITLAEARARFAPGALQADLGTLKMAARTRHCNDVTGCGPWAPFDKLPYGHVYSTPQYGAMTKAGMLPIVDGDDASRVWYAAKTQTWPQDPIRLRVSYLSGKDQGLDLNLPFNLSGKDGAPVYTHSTYTPSAVGGCFGGLGCPDSGRIYGGRLSAVAEEAIVTTSCMRFVVNRRVRPDKSTQYDEYQTVFFSKF